MCLSIASCLDMLTLHWMTAARTVVIRPPSSGQGWDELLSERLDHLFRFIDHRVEVELIDPGLVQLSQLSFARIDRPDHAEAVYHIVGDEGRVFCAGSPVVLVVVVIAGRYVFHELPREILWLVPLHQVDHMVRHQCREPADLVPGVAQVLGDVCRGCGHHRHLCARPGATPSARRRRSRWGVLAPPWPT